MTTLYLAHDPSKDDDAGEMFGTQTAALKKATDRRKEGDDTTVNKLTIKKLPKAQLLAAIYNRDLEQFVEEIDVVKEVKGVKHPKKAAA
jgi:hypothetical protein